MTVEELKVEKRKAELEIMDILSMFASKAGVDVRRVEAYADLSGGMGGGGSVCQSACSLTIDI